MSKNNIPAFVSNDEIKAYSLLCALVEHKNDSEKLEYNISHERLEQLEPLIPMIKRITTMIDIMAPHLTAPVLDEKGVLKYYAEEAQRLIEHENDICTPEYWIMKENYEQRHKND